MKLVSFNINSLRARIAQLEAVIAEHAPDAIGLQETKVTDEDFPEATIQALGYHALYTGQKTHYGVALLTKTPATLIANQWANEDTTAQRRTIIAEVQGTTIINGYFPQGENKRHATKFPAKRAYYANLTDYVRAHMADTPDKPLVIMGDFNIAPHDDDVGIANAADWLKRGSCSFLPEERAWYAELLSLGLADTYRIRYPTRNDTFSWFDYRTRAFERTEKRGLRIDHILVNAPLHDKVREAGINYPIRGMEKPSDHCPVWCALSS